MEGDRYAAAPRSPRQPGEAAAVATRPPDERTVEIAPGAGGPGERLEVAIDVDGCLRLRGGRPPEEAGTAEPEPDRDAGHPARLQRHVREDGVLVIGASGQRSRVEIGRDPFRLRLAAPGGAPIAALRRLAWQSQGGVEVALALDPNARVLGGGDAPGPLDRRGSRLEAGAGAPGRLPAPFLLVHPPPDAPPRGPGSWGVLVGGPPGRVRFDVGAEDAGTLAIAIGSGALDLWILPGPRPADVVERLTARTGRCPLPPRWALGHHVVTGAASDARAGALVERLRAREIPVDAVHRNAVPRADRGLRLRRDHETTPPEDGVRSVVWVAPDVRIDPEDAVYRDGLARGVFERDARGRVLARRRAARPDLARADARAWWRARHRAWIEAGADGFWSGAAPPDGGRWRARGDPGAGVARHAARQAEAARRALEEARPGTRAFVLAEAGGPGVASAAALLAGEGPGGWRGLRTRVPRLLSLSLSGVPFCGADLGPRGAPPELFARAVQLASLQPLLRSRGAALERALARGRLGPRIDAIARDAFALRARLLPYLESLLRDAEATGAPVWRPLLWSFPDDADAAAVDDQFLLGPALLVAPVCEPGVREREVHLPPGDWFAWHDHALYRGPRRLRVAAPLERLPLFVRAGSVLPTRAPRAADGEPGVPVLEVFPGHDGACDWVCDDGETLAYRDGQTARASVRLWSRAGARLRVELGRREGGLRPTDTGVCLAIHACPPPRRVLLDGARLPERDAAPGWRVDEGGLRVRLAESDRGAAVEVEARA